MAEFTGPPLSADDEYHEETPDMEFGVSDHDGDLRRLSETQPLVPIRIERRGSQRSSD